MKHNFGAGPCILPKSVFEEASKSVINFNGLSILEISHRSKDFVDIMEEAQSLVKKILNVPEGYSVLFIQGGASLGFTISALNMISSSKPTAGYINTGTWSQGAINEAKNIGIKVNTIASSEDQNFNYIPKNININQNFDFIHYTSNNTIFGTQFQDIVNTDSPLICDMSSDIFSKKIDVSKFDIIYAGAQKNLGPAGATLFIVKNRIFDKSFGGEFMPKYLNLKNHINKKSMLNTPPVFSIYTSMLNLRYMNKIGGIEIIESNNNLKALKLYEEIDSNPLFKSTVKGIDRSKMNVTFLLTNESLKEIFDKMWNEAGIIGLKGHRSVGGYRASIYNALPLESVKILIEVMKEFSKKNG